jgi:hypothetical protein
MKRTKVLGLILIANLMAGCSAQSTDPLSATGDTLIRYVICNADDANCFVSARFKDFDSCESHKKWSEMLCDSQTMPGQMTCRENHASLVVAYCTK